ncbi:MAG: L-lactate dehydrogenase [Clostridia bacterium]|nr:L-lactate dehydrogenase [Clostridia bacterium]
MKTKVVILGAGHVGSHVASALAQGTIANEIVLVDKLPGKAAAQAADIADSLSFLPDCPLVREGVYADCADADVTVCANGKPREPGQTRLDLLADSVRMIRELSAQLQPTPPAGIVISITNPCDIISDCLRQALSMDRARCFGTGTLLDSARLKRIVSEQTGAPRAEIGAVALGEHGDSSMIPYSCLTVRGKPALETPVFDAEEALKRTHQTGMDIIEGKGSTEFGIGLSTARLIRAILNDENAVLPLSVAMEGEYSVSGVNCGVPCRVGRDGIREVIELPLTAAEREAFDSTISVLKRYTELAKQA